ncbi:putative PRKR-interacting protein [Septoria linicola]|nr:putative PRKR-interacting protein [Septoria linicola]
MSENVPESIPTSMSSRSNRPTKKRALGPSSAQSQQVEALFANPDRDISLTASGKAKSLAAPPEIVANVQGSSAGAGSGEFHVYKASRRREYERQRLMDEETKEEEAEREFREKKEKREQEDREKLEKNRAKREKNKARKGKKGKGGGGEEGMEGVEQSGVKKRLAPQKVGSGEREEDGQQDEAEAVQEETGITIHDDD